jgi:hypothetical protein
MCRPLILVLFVCATLNPLPAQPIVPLPDATPWQISGNPNLGRYQKATQQPVDFCIWQAADGTWQLWSCMRNTAYPGNTRLLYGWEGRKLTDSHWKPTGIKMTSEPRLGEAEGGLQAPHVVRVGKRFIMAYGDWENICFAESTDGKAFRRIIQPNGKTAAFSEGPRSNTRDPQLIRIGNLWHCYYTAIVGEKGYIFCRTSPDLKTWSPSCVVAYGGKVGTGPWWAECPFVAEPAPGEFILLRNKYYGTGAQHWSYYSKNPLNFGIDYDGGLTSEFPTAAPEIVRDGNAWYLATLRNTLDGIQLTRLHWGRLARVGKPVFDFADPHVRADFKLKSGDLPFTFTRQTHVAFRGETDHVIGTAETPQGGFDDHYTGVIESPSFTLTESEYRLLIAGSGDAAKARVALVDATSGAELARWAGHFNNELEVVTFDAAKLKGRQARLQVIDASPDPWGHINFGGLFTAPQAHRID